MLASRDAAVGFRAVVEMGSSPEAALALLGRMARPDPEAARRVRAIMPRLDADDFETRRTAEKDLERIGPAAEPALVAAWAVKQSLDVQAALRRLLARLERGPSEHLRRLRLVEVLEHLGTPQAHRLLDGLGPHWPDADAARRRLRASAGPGP